MSGTIFLHSLMVGFGAVVLSSGFGMMAATLAWALSGWGRRAILALALTSLLLPPFLLANAWLGWMASWRAVQTPEAVEWANLPLTAAALAGLLWPVPAVLSFQALRQIPGVQLEMEPRLTGWRLLRWLVWPAVRPGLQASVPLLLALALANFTVPTLFQVRVFTEAFWVRFNTRLDAWEALSAAWPLLIPPLLLVFLPRPRAFRLSVSSFPVPSSLVRHRMGPWFFWLMVLVLGWLAAVLFGPLLSLLTAGRTWTELPGAVSAGRDAWSNSLASSLVPASIVAVLAMAWVAVQRQPRGPRLAWLLFLVPGVFLGVVAIPLFNRPGLFAFYQSAGIQWLMLSLRYWPLAWAVVAAVSGTAGGPLADAARLAGASAWQRWRVSHFPRLLRPVAALWMVIVSLCLWDVESVILVQPPGGETLALRIFNLLHYGHASQVNALAVLLLATALAMAGLLTLVIQATGPRNSRTATGRPAGSWLWKPLALVMSFGLWTGCHSRSDGTTTALQSSLFSEVRVMGTRGTAPGQFNKPRSLVCDREDNLYVVDMTGRVQKFDPNGKWLLQWQMPETELGKPKGMGLDPDGNILVVEPHYQRINHFSPSGQLLAQWGKKGTALAEMILPRSIVVTSKREYLISEYTVVDRIQRFTISWKASSEVDPSSAAGNSRVVPFHFEGSWGEPGLKSGQFNRAEGMGIDVLDQVYVADSCNHRIQVFSPEGRFLRTYGHAGRSPGEFSYPYDIKVDGQGRQYVCEFGNSRITILDASDRLLEVVGGPGGGSEPGQFANPWSIALNSVGDLYVADSQNHRVQKFLSRHRSAAHSAAGHSSGGQRPVMTAFVPVP
jgi:ABC-type Fe3+ transport system permease subunit/DNA-binding beta-propeller fold protein YncE